MPSKPMTESRCGTATPSSAAARSAPMRQQVVAGEDRRDVAARRAARRASSWPDGGAEVAFEQPVVVAARCRRAPAPCASRDARAAHREVRRARRCRRCAGGRARAGARPRAARRPGGRCAPGRRRGPGCCGRRPPSALAPTRGAWRAPARRPAGVASSTPSTRRSSSVSAGSALALAVVVAVAEEHRVVGCARSTSSMPRISSEKNGLVMLGTMHAEDARLAHLERPRHRARRSSPSRRSRARRAAAPSRSPRRVRFTRARRW